MGFVFAMAGTGGDWREVPLPLGFRGFSERKELASLRLNVGLVHIMGHISQYTKGQGPISNKQLSPNPKRGLSQKKTKKDPSSKK